jgi:nitroimidazol reductase NimA-like FMN-containing flavoprotein (pyridoxamine 5'-phosphate oxidase superfamily)
MIKLSDDIVHFFQDQGCVLISTVDEKGCPTAACKSVVEMNSAGTVYLLDLYMAKTYANLKANPLVCLTAIDEHKFKGYCLKGRARIVSKDDIPARILKLWEDKITSRLTKRLLRNLREEKGHPRHPEILLPHPTYMIAVDINEIVDLTPRQLKEKTA